MVKVLGLDEAGRGPVLGPMIIAGAMIEEGREAMLGEVKDSKLIRHKQRIILSENIKKQTKYEIIIVEPKEIDEALLSETLNLNWLEAHKQAEIINKLKPDVAIVDCPSINESGFKKYLQDLLDNKNIKLIVEHKADVEYPICSAASILAKVERENQMDKIKEKYGNTGPGYPSNKTTQDFVKKNWNKPECSSIMRKTWSTYKKAAKGKSQMKITYF
tara:strand:- start:1 stop:651 length:651 start_codon:yes stop_codon:yes gene_type:complete